MSAAAAHALRLRELMGLLAYRGQTAGQDEEAAYGAQQWLMFVVRVLSTCLQRLMFVVRVLPTCLWVSGLPRWPCLPVRLDDGMGCCT